MLEIFLLLFIIIFFIAFIPFIIRTGPPYVPTHPKTVEQMIALARISGGVRVADLGSGDGRLIMAAARAGAIAHGYEINPVLAIYSRWKIRRAGLAGRAFVHRGDFWKVSLADYDIILLYGITHIMPRLEEKLRRELPSGARVISNGFAFPNWPLTDALGGVLLYLKK